MSVEVVAILREGPRLDDIKSALETILNVSVEVFEFPTQILDGRYELRFNDPDGVSGHRRLSVDFDAHDEEALQEDILAELGGASTIYLTLGSYGNAVGVMQSLASRFDGWLCDEAQSDDFFKAAGFEAKGFKV